MAHSPRHADKAQPARAAGRTPGRGRTTPTRAVLPEARRAAGADEHGRRRSGRLPWLAAGVVALATVAGLALPNLSPQGPRIALPVPGGPSAASTTTTSPAPPDTVTTYYAAGAYATPQTGGMRLVPTAQGPLTGKVIVVDPGHNGKYSRSINERNYYTYGAGWRPCVQAGTTTYTNVPENQIVWEIANKVVPHLLARGATVVVTRVNNEGYGPCNNERPEIANREGASLLMSLHVDGNDNKTLRGFYVAYSERMLGGPAVQAASREAAQIFARHIMSEAGHPASNYVGEPNNPTYVRNDLAVLDGVKVAPAVLIEWGNSRNPEDVAFLTQPESQERYARALAAAAEEAVLSLPANPDAGPASPSPAAPQGSARPPETSTPSPVAAPSAEPDASAPAAPAPSPSA